MLSPVWADWVDRTLQMILLDPSPPPADARLAGGLVALALLVDVACSWFFPRKRAFHDWLLRTEVVLESTDKASPAR